MAALAAALALLAFMAVDTGTAAAHPLGNFTINQYSRIEPGANYVTVVYVLDMAEIPTFQEMRQIDLDGDGTVDAQERWSYLVEKAGSLKDGLLLALDGTEVPLTLQERQLEFPPGAGDLSTLRLTLGLSAPIGERTVGESVGLYYRNHNYERRAGWKEIVVRPGPGVTLTESSAAGESRSDELRSYPTGYLDSPPDEREARSILEIVGPGELQPPIQAPTKSRTADEPGDILTSLLRSEDLTLPVLALAVLVAVGLGALHAASPGHGKTIMAAYLVGARGTVRHAVLLGLTVTVSHTVGVLALGLLVLYASHLIAPERLYPWLGLVSGAVIITLGMWLLAGRSRRASEAGHSHQKYVGSGHIHSGAWHAHTPPSGERSPGGRTEPGPRVNWKSLTALGVVGGLLPSASAVIILLAAISLQRIGFGMLLILAFSLGMAGVLTAIGLVLVYARQAAARVTLRVPFAAAVAGRIPLITAVVVLVSGLVVAIRAAYQVGLV